MKFSNNTILTLLTLINKVADSVSGKTAYAMLRNRQILANEIKPFEEMRDKLIAEYGTTNPETGEIVINAEQGSEEYNKFLYELTEILNMEIDVDTYKIPEKDFKLEFNDNMTLRDYDMLYRLTVG